MKRAFAMVSALLALGLGAGCDLMGNGNGNSRTSDQRRERRLEQRKGMDLPKSAVKVDVADGDRLSYKADRDGTVYVVDAERNRVVYEGELRDGERIVVDPDTDRIEVDGRSVSGEQLHAKHRYQLFFDRG